METIAVYTYDKRSKITRNEYQTATFASLLAEALKYKENPEQQPIVKIVIKIFINQNKKILVINYLHKKHNK